MLKSIARATVALVALTVAASAGDMAKPTGKVVLTVSGKIENRNSEGGAM
jgi:hypothetical protein